MQFIYLLILMPYIQRVLQQVNRQLFSAYHQIYTNFVNAHLQTPFRDHTNLTSLEANFDPLRSRRLTLTCRLTRLGCRRTMDRFQPLHTSRPPLPFPMLLTYQVTSNNIKVQNKLNLLPTYISETTSQISVIDMHYDTYKTGIPYHAE